MSGLRATGSRLRAGSWVVLLGILACGAGSRSSDPARTVEEFVAAARAGDAARVFGTLGPRTRVRLENTLRSAERVSGRLALAPYDFLSVGRAPPSWEATQVRTVRRDDGEALVEVFSAAGDRHDLRLVNEGGHWKIELPGS